MWFVQKLRSEYFPHGANNLLIRASLYSYRKPTRNFSEEFSENFWKSDSISFEGQLHCHINFRRLFGEFSVNCL